MEKAKPEVHLQGAAGIILQSDNRVAGTKFPLSLVPLGMGEVLAKALRFKLWKQWAPSSYNLHSESKPHSLRRKSCTTPRFMHATFSRLRAQGSPRSPQSTASEHSGA